MNETTISIITDLLATLFLLAGLFFMVVGVVGLNRFPDPYGKLHATTKCVTLGLLGMLLAVIFHIAVLPIVTKAIMTIVFVFIANPVGSHMIAKAAHQAGYRKWERTLSDELEEDRAAGRLSSEEPEVRETDVAAESDRARDEAESDAVLREAV